MSIRRAGILSILWIVLFMCFGTLLFAQNPIANYGIKQYGNTFDQPFHTSENIRQDSVGRLIFEQGEHVYVFDGISFNRSSAKTLGNLVLIDDVGNRWYHKPDQSLTRCGIKDTLTFNVKEYFESGMNYLYQKEDSFRLVSHHRIATFFSHKDSLEFLTIDSFENFVAYAAYEIGDTMFVKSLPRSRVVLNKGFSHAAAYGVEEIEDYPNKNGIFLLPNNRILVMSGEDVSFFPLASPYFGFIRSFHHERIKALHQDKEGKMWIVSSVDNRHGLFIFDPDTEEITSIPLDPDLASNTRAMYEDKEGDMWLATSGSGLIHIYEKAIHVLGEAAGLPDENIWSTCQAENGTVYLTTRCDGIGMMKPNHSIEIYAEKACAWAVLPVKDKVWVSDDGIKLLDNGRLLRHMTKADGLLSRRVFSIYKDGRGEIWMGTRTAIHKMMDDHIEKYIIPSAEIYDGVFNIEEYEPGKLIVALQSGRVFTYENGLFSEVTFTDNPVTRILKDQEGRIWVSTDGIGLYLFQNNKFIRLKLAPASILQMQDDNQGNLWGIMRENKMFYVRKDALIQGDSTIKINYLTSDHGLPLIGQNYDAQPSTTLLQDGRVLFPNIHGAILIDVDQIKRPFSEFNIQVKNGGVSGYVHDLAYGENDVRFQLLGISLHPERPIEFQYKYDGDWQQVDFTTNEFSLNNLSKGKHNVFVRGRYKNQSWFAPKILKIDVQPLIYQKTGIQFLALFFVLGGMFFVVKWRTGIVKRQNEYLSEKVQEQTKEIENEKQQLAQSLDQQQQLTKELSLSQKAKNRLYAQIAHEFKSPLQAMNTYLSKSQVSLTSSDQNRIAKNINNLLNTSNEILELSKAESGKLVAKKNYYNINSIISDQLELMQSLIADRQLELVFPQKNEKAYLYIDISLFQKVIANLLSNAIKFSPLNSTIQITSEHQDGSHFVAVKDQGPGIPEDEVSNLVLPYFQATNNIVGGTGIGLSFVESILKLHDSHLEIDTAIGSGSTFSFELTRPEISQAEIVNQFVDEHDVKNQLARLVNKNKPMILAVDDNEGVLHFYLSTLSTQYNVITAVNGENALSALKHIKPDIIISDVNMPIMGGVELLKSVRKQAAFKAVPFFFVTGSTSDEMEIQSMKSGVDIILKKPIQEAYLLSRVERALNLKSDLEDLVKSDFSHNLLPPDIQDDDLMMIQEMETIILDQINNNKLKSAEIASLLGIGERTLRNRVKSISGLTIKEYLKNYRLEKAKILIEQSERTKAEIATAVGFSSLSYFSKSYKAYFGKKD